MADPYEPPDGNKIGLEFGASYTPPAGNVVGIEFVRDAGPPSETQYTFPVGEDQLIIGALAIRLQRRFVSPAGVNTLATGTAGVRNRWTFARPTAFNAALFGTATIRNLRRPLSPPSLVATLFGSTRIYNYLQYRSIQGFNAGLYGNAFVQGGVKYVTPAGMFTQSIPQPTVVNTTANRTLTIPGIATPGMGAAKVSPQTVRPFGFIGTIGIPMVQRNPSPLGFVTNVWGTPSIYFKTRTLHAPGIDAFATGYPNIRDRAQKVFHTASPVTTVFGDIAARLKTMHLTVPGINAFASSSFAEIRSTRRYLTASSVPAPTVGSSTDIRNKTPSLSPHGFNAAVFGRLDHTVIGWRIRSVYPVGVPAPLGPLGIPSLWQTPGLRPPGIAAPVFPTPTIWPAIRTVEAKGRDAQLFGESVVTFRYRPVKPDTFTATRYGTARVEHGNRFMAVLGTSHLRIGDAWISYGQRSVTVTGIPVQGIPTHRVGGTQFIRPGGYEATRWGTRVIPESQTLAPLGFSNPYGWPEVRNRKAFLRPASILTTPQPADSWGTAKVYNARQYITMTFDFASELNPPPIVGWTSVLNRNRTIHAFGSVSPAPSMPRIDNAGRLIQPGGIAMPVFPIKSMVAYRIRQFIMEGIEPVPMSRWSAVYNTAVVLKPSGIAVPAAGLPEIANTRRNFRFIGAIDSQAFGTAFVAPRVRTVAMDPRYSIGAPIIALPNVKLHTRYVEPLGINAMGNGAPNLVIKFNILYPKWVLQHFFGVAALHNVTPELRHKGRNSEEFGDAAIRTQWRKVIPDGSNMQLFGRATIADRKQTISVPGNNYATVSAKHVVTKTGAPPYWPQYITVDEGIESTLVIPKPGLNQFVLYPASASPMTRFGEATVRSNVIQIDAGIATEWYGRPNVALKRRYIQAAGWYHDNSPMPPRLSPHTIWAVKEAPAQAKANHEVAGLHYVGETNFYPPGERFGSHRIFILRDTIERATAGEFSRFGFPGLHLRKRYITPASMTPFRFGFHRIGDGTQFVNQFSASNTMVFGTPAFTRPPYTGPQTVRPNGFNAQGFPVLHWVSLKNRTLPVAGFSALRMGSSRGEPAYQWQSLHVGPPMPTIPNGFNAERFGLTWISLRVRNLEVEGFDSFLCEYDPEAFAKRLRVRNGTQPTKPAQTITPVGVDCLKLGVPNVRLGVHFIRPDGNSDQYRKGAW